MLTKFWEKMGEGLSARWLEYLLGPAFLFWGGGLLIMVFNIGFYTVWNWITGRDVPTQVILLLAGVFLLFLSSKLMEQVRFGFLRLLEGYWRWPLRYLADPLRKWQWKRIQRGRDRWNALMERKEKGLLTYEEARQLARLEMDGHYAPTNAAECLPTGLGNILRAAESAPWERYGLDAVVCWPRLWLLLPKDCRDALAESRRRLDTLVELWAWGLIFLVWAIWWPWAILVSLLWQVIAYRLALDAARVYADLFISAFDLHRWSLYESAHWEKPAVSGATEVALGQRLSEFFWRGTSESPVTYQ